MQHRTVVVVAAAVIVVVVLSMLLLYLCYKYWTQAHDTLQPIYENKLYTQTCADGILIFPEKYAFNSQNHKPL